MDYARRQIDVHVPLERAVVEPREHLHCDLLERERDLIREVSIDLEKSRADLDHYARVFSEALGKPSDIAMSHSRRGAEAFRVTALFSAWTLKPKAAI
jgi:hypothetical protein